MPFASALSTSLPTLRALEEVCAVIAQEISGPADLVLAFFSPHHADEAEAIAAPLQQKLSARAVLGCIGESIVGGSEEIEHKPALCVWAAKWPGAVQLDPFQLLVEQTPDGLCLLGLPDSLIGADGKSLAMLLLGDPFSFRVDLLLKLVNEDCQGLRVMGGMASGVRGPGQVRLICGDSVLKEGAVGVVLGGVPGLRSIVSQGCRPIGKHMVITGGHENVITELGGKPPLAQLQALWQELPPHEQVLFQQGLHIGLVMNEYQGSFRRGDFLVRNVYGLEKESGALVIADHIRVGQTVQFHIRDAATADEDLRTLLQEDLQGQRRKPAGALLFTCNGRGTRMFAEPHHDATLVRQEAGELPLAGFFAQGELGPVGGQNFIHGFTASVVLFEE